MHNYKQIIKNKKIMQKSKNLILDFLICKLSMPLNNLYSLRVDK